MNHEERMSVAERARRDTLVDEYRRYVHYIVGRMISTMHLPSSMNEDFVAAGYLGLVEAAQRFDFDSGVDFRHFAFLRIRGAIIDGIRSNTNLSGRAYRNLRAMAGANAVREEAELGRARRHEPSGNAVRDAMDTLAGAALAFRLSMSDAEEELNERSDASDPETLFANRQQLSLLREHVSRLPEKERVIMESHYYHNKSFAQIAREAGGISKSWVSRLHGRAIARLRDSMSETPHDQ